MMRRASDGSIRILLIEDSEHDRLAFRRALRDSGSDLQIDHCFRAEDALEQLKEDPTPWQLVVADHKLPGMSGLDFCLELRRRGLDLPLIMLTGGGSEELAALALKSGVDDYVVKDTARGYLRLLPLVIPQVLRKVQDRKARQAAEKALAESEARYRAVVEDQSEMVVRFDPSGRLTFVNEATCRFAGRRREELLGRSFLAFLGRDERRQLRDTLRAVAAVSPLSVHEQFLMREGEACWIEWKNTAFFDSHGRLIEVQSVGRDISERKRAEEEKEKLILQLQGTLDKVKTLSGLLPICASCKKIRNDEGYWQQVEVYIRDRSEVEFTHGLCPHCMERLYPEITRRLVRKRAEEMREREEWDETLAAGDESLDETGVSS